MSDDQMRATSVTASIPQLTPIGLSAPALLTHQFIMSLLSLTIGTFVVSHAFAETHKTRQGQSTCWQTLTRHPVASQFAMRVMNFVSGQTPAHSSADFSVRFFETPLDPNLARISNPLALREVRAYDIAYQKLNREQKSAFIKRINYLNAKFKGWDFNTRPYYHAIVESLPNSIPSISVEDLRSTKPGRLNHSAEAHNSQLTQMSLTAPPYPIWPDSTATTSPLVSNASRHHPGRLDFYQLGLLLDVTGSFVVADRPPAKGGSPLILRYPRQRDAKVLLIPHSFFEFSDDAQHFALAHEIAHIYQSPQPLRGAGSYSNMWFEARADFLAYAATGIHTVTQAKTPTASVHRNSIHHRLMFRDLVHPVITNLDEVLPIVDQYHINSALISSLLYDVSEVFDTTTVVDLIQWLDAEMLYLAYEFINPDTEFGTSLAQLAVASEKQSNTDKQSSQRLAEIYSLLDPTVLKSNPLLMVGTTPRDYRSSFQQKMITNDLIVLANLIFHFIESLDADPNDLELIRSYIERRGVPLVLGQKSK